MKKEERKHLEQIMRRDIMYIQGVQMEEAVEIVRHCFFRDEEMQVMEYEIHSPEEFRDAYMKFIPYWNFERCINELHENTGKESFLLLWEMCGMQFAATTFGRLSECRA